MGASSSANKQRVVVVVGPTASGKSALAMALARRFSGEIVSADSVQWIKGFDIGSAKPTPEERALVPHHLIDCLAPDEAADVALFVRLARAAIADIGARGKLPIVCGGTGLYCRALLGGLVELPGRDAKRRAEYEALLAAQGLGALCARLTAQDPEAAAHHDLANPVRVIRALEVLETTGRPLWQWQREHAFAERPYEALQLALTPAPETLKARIEARTRAMLEAGLLNEVRALLAAYPDPTLNPYGSIGYKEALAVLRGDLPERELASAINQATWRYVKKQYTWLKAEKSLIRLGEASETDIFDRVARFLASTP